MAKFELKFLDKRNNFTKIKTEVNINNDISIIISIGSSYTQIVLDKSTAIKFAKTLRTEINKITEMEGKNG